MARMVFGGSGGRGEVGKVADLKRVVRSLMRTMEWDNLTIREAEMAVKMLKKAIKKNSEQIEKDKLFTVRKQPKSQK